MRTSDPKFIKQRRHYNSAIPEMAFWYGAAFKTDLADVLKADLRDTVGRRESSRTRPKQTSSSS
jgi:hypothetical protein